MRVLSLCEYLVGSSLAPDHFEPWYIVHGIKKDKPLKGGRNVQVRGKAVGIMAGQEDVAIVWAAERIGAQLDAEFQGEKIAIVPVPGSSCADSDAVKNGRVFALAHTIARLCSQCDSIASPLIHWDEPQPRAHDQGGTRDREQLRDLLRTGRASKSSVDGRTIVLLDDVVTSGGHMLGCRDYLVGAGYDVADIAFAAARTVHVRGEPLKTLVEELPRDDDRPPLF